MVARCLAIASTVGLLMALFSAVSAAASTQQLPTELPPLQAHPLPPSLAVWQSAEPADDYFDQVQPTPVGYLVWSRFPVLVFIEPPAATVADRSAEWSAAVAAAVQEWRAYLPLALTQEAEAADIRVWRRSPPLQGWGNRLQRVRSAQTRYELYVDRARGAILSHRCEIWLRPGQTAAHLQAAARHELGHAIGIWGHSPDETDALYFAQVRQPLPVSARDINTLKRVYMQPTRLGWAAPAAAIQRDWNLIATLPVHR